MIVIFSHKQKLVQTESKNKFTIEPQPMFVNTLQRYEGFFILLLLQSNKCYFLLKKTKARAFVRPACKESALQPFKATNTYSIRESVGLSLHIYPSLLRNDCFFGLSPIAIRHRGEG